MDKIKIVCAMDGDAHYRAAKLSDRKSVWKILTKHIEDGCYWDDLSVEEDSDIEKKYETMEENDWINLIRRHTARGRMEIVEI